MKQKSIKNIRQEFKDNGVFYAPPELAKRLLECVEKNHKRVRRKIKTKQKKIDIHGQTNFETDFPEVMP